MNTPLNDALKPCPICATSAKVVRVQGASYALCTNWKCSTKGPVKALDDQAISAWNTRSTSPESSAAQGAMGDVVLTDEQEARYSAAVGFDKLTGLSRLATRLAMKLNMTGKGLIDYNAAVTFAKEWQTLAQPSDATAQPIEQNYAPGEWFNVKTIDEMSAFYMSRLPAIREAAKELGFAIGLHGSTRRDFDLMAMPWRDDAADNDALAHAIAMAACGITRDCAYQWEQKPLGRVATSIPICWVAKEIKQISSGHIDLSIISLMPSNAVKDAQPTACNYIGACGCKTPCDVAQPTDATAQPSDTEIANAINAIGKMSTAQGISVRELPRAIALVRNLFTAQQRVDLTDERAAFEAWYEADCMPCESDWFRRDMDGDYHLPNTNAAWSGWRAKSLLANTAQGNPEYMPTDPEYIKALDEGRERIAAHWAEYRKTQNNGEG